MAKVGMILDVTHLSDQCFDEALECYGGPVLASHHNCRELVPDQRQITDDQIKRLVARGGVIGAALDAWMLYPGWVRGVTTPTQAGVKLEAMVDHIDRVCQLAGNARHAAIGTDLGGGTEQTATSISTICSLPTCSAIAATNPRTSEHRVPWVPFPRGMERVELNPQRLVYAGTELMSHHDYLRLTASR